MTAYGVHYDDNPSGAAYDYPQADGSSAWLRGELIGNSNTSRYMYWNESSCRVRARMQVWDTGTSVWIDIYDYDVDVLHLANMPASTSYTQTFAANGDWFYKTVGTLAQCGTTQYHSHLEVTPSAVVSISAKTNNTCWEDGSYCSIGTVRKDSGTGNCPPGTSSGTDAHKSGSVTRYKCETWSSQSFSDGTSAFVFN